MWWANLAFKPWCTWDCYTQSPLSVQPKLSTSVWPFIRQAACKASLNAFGLHLVLSAWGTCICRVHQYTSRLHQHPMGVSIVDASKRHADVWTLMGLDTCAGTSWGVEKPCCLICQILLALRILQQEELHLRPSTSTPQPEQCAAGEVHSHLRPQQSAQLCASWPAQSTIIPSSKSVSPEQGVCIQLAGGETLRMNGAQPHPGYIDSLGPPPAAPGLQLHPPHPNGLEGFKDLTALNGSADLVGANGFAALDAPILPDAGAKAARTPSPFMVNASQVGTRSSTSTKLKQNSHSRCRVYCTKYCRGPA